MSVKAGLALAAFSDEGAVRRQHLGLRSAGPRDVVELMAEHQLGQRHHLGGLRGRRLEGLQRVRR